MKTWVLFGLLGLIWGCSFLLIKIGIRGLDAVALTSGSFAVSLVIVSGRLGVSALAFITALAALRKKLPSDTGTLAKLALIGIINTALPFMLITWGETSIDTGLAGVLNSTTPLFSLIIAHLALADDKINLNKLIGLIAGFAGVMLLATRSADPSHQNPLAGQLAVLGAACAYACSAVFTRRTLRHLEPLVVAGVSHMFGAVAVLFFTFIVVRPVVNLAIVPGDAILSVITLGIVNTFLANTMYFTILAAWGASRTTMVTYLISPVGLAVGALFNHEVLDLRLIVGAALVLCGVAVVNMRYMGKTPTAKSEETPAEHPTPAAPMLPAPDR